MVWCRGAIAHHRRFVPGRRLVGFGDKAPGLHFHQIAACRVKAHGAAHKALDIGELLGTALPERRRIEHHRHRQALQPRRAGAGDGDILADLEIARGSLGSDSVAHGSRRWRWWRIAGHLRGLWHGVGERPRDAGGSGRRAV